jgi:hypothetical protein
MLNRLDLTEIMIMIITVNERFNIIYVRWFLIKIYLNFGYDFKWTID